MDTKATLNLVISSLIASIAVTVGMIAGNGWRFDPSHLHAALMVGYVALIQHLRSNPIQAGATKDVATQALIDALMSLKPVPAPQVNPAPQPPGPMAAQGGFARIGMLLLVFLVSVACGALLSGCQSNPATPQPAAIDVPKTLKVLELGAASVVAGVKSARSECASAQCKVTDADVQRAEDLALAVKAAVHSYAATYQAACPVGPSSAVSAGTCVPPPLSALEAALSCTASSTTATDCPMSRLVTLATDLGALK